MGCCWSAEPDPERERFLGREKAAQPISVGNSNSIKNYGNLRADPSGRHGPGSYSSSWGADGSITDEGVLKRIVRRAERDFIDIGGATPAAKGFLESREENWGGPISAFSKAHTSRLENALSVPTPAGTNVLALLHQPLIPNFFDSNPSIMDNLATCMSMEVEHRGEVLAVLSTSPMF